MNEDSLKNLYIDKAMSMQEIANHFGYSVHKVSYWLKKYSIAARTNSEATYVN